MSVHGFVTDVLRHDTRIFPILRSVGNLHRSGKCPCPRNGECGIERVSAQPVRGGG